MTEGAASIDPSRCRACNLCILKCPHRAITLGNAELLEKLIMEYKNLESVRSIRRFMEKPKIGILDKILIFRNLKHRGLV